MHLKLLSYYMYCRSSYYYYDYITATVVTIIIVVAVVKSFGSHLNLSLNPLLSALGEAEGIEAEWSTIYFSLFIS